MTKFTFQISQDITRESVIEIEADSITEAKKMINSLSHNDSRFKWTISNFSELSVEDL